MKKPVKLSNKQLRNIVEGVVNEAAFSQDASKFAEYIKDNRSKLGEDDMDSAASAGYNLDQLSHLFYGTPWEKAVKDVMMMLSAIEDMPRDESEEGFEPFEREET